MVGERIDYLAANRQIQRAKELKEFLQLTEEEHFNVFEMVPQSAQDMYYAKLQAGSIKTAIVSTKDDFQIEKDI